MSRLRSLLAIVTLVAMAMLPGPSHALAHSAQHRAVSTHHAGHDAHGHATDEAGTHVLPADGVRPCRRHGSGHGPCKACSIACCAPTTAAIDEPCIAAADFELRLRPPRPEADRDRPNAERTRALRPPAAA